MIILPTEGEAVVATILTKNSFTIVEEVHDKLPMLEEINTNPNIALLADNIAEVIDMQPNIAEIAALGTEIVSIAASINGGVFKGDKGDKGNTGDKGIQGEAATIAIGNVTQGSSMAVTNSGTPGAAILNFTIIKGDTGDTGATGATGYKSVMAVVSSTSNTISNTPKTFEFPTQSNLGWALGQRLRVFYNATNYMEGVISGFLQYQVTVDIDRSVGSGTYSLWFISIAGDVGNAGEAGASTYAALTDKISADLPAINTPLFYALADKQASLVSGTNIKTVNSTSLLGSGNITTGNVSTTSNNIFTGTNRFDSTVEINSGMIDLNNTQGVSGQIWRSSGNGVPPQWTSINTLLKACNGVEIDGSGDFVVYRSGTGTIANGSYGTTITFSSMGFTPTLEHISITLGGGADYHARVNSITSTSFVVGTNQDAGDKPFGWRILKFNP